MKKILIVIAVLLGNLNIVVAGETPLISVIDSATPTRALLNKPGTYLGENFVYEANHSGDVAVRIGVWEAGAGEFEIKDFPFTEYVLMISGSVIVTEINGDSMKFSVGDTFVIPKGWNGSWMVLERMKKQIVRIGNAENSAIEVSAD